MTTPISGSRASGSATSDAAPAGPSRSRPAAAIVAERQSGWRRLIRPALVLISVVLVADSLIGDKGLLEHRRQAKRREVIAQELDQRRRENQELRSRARRLRDGHPPTVEDLARRKLGMIKAGELLFVVRDADTPPVTPRTPPAR